MFTAICLCRAPQVVTRNDGNAIPAPAEHSADLDASIEGIPEDARIELDSLRKQLLDGKWTCHCVLFYVA